jgi:ribose transport system ATP-binding protein
MAPVQPEGRDGTVALSVSGIGKAYPGVQALAGVSFTVHTGQVVGLVGENGAGKSTLLSVINGLVVPDEGTVEVNGVPLRPGQPAEAAARGVSTVYQEQGLIPSLTVYENLFLGRERRFTRAGVPSRRRMIRSAQRTLDDLSIRVDPRASVGELGFTDRQMVEIAKAFALTEAYDVRPVILLDEPTSALTEQETETLLGNILAWRDRATFVFVSHRLQHVFGVCDRLVILKDGRQIAELAASATDEEALHELIVGRKRDAEYYREARQVPAAPEIVLTVTGLGHRTAFRDVDLVVRRGEIVGVGGIAGCGKSELARSVAGLDGHVAGTVRLDGEPLRSGALATAIRRGVAYVPAERQREGIIGGQSVAANLLLPSLPRLRSRGSPFLGRRVSRDLVRRWLSTLDVRVSRPDVLARTLSGGNQQKVVFAKWLARGVRLLVLDDPGRGLDVGAKEEVYDLLRSLTADGVGVLLVSDNLPELIGLSHRIVVMRDGVVTAELPAPADAKPAEADVVRNMV